MSISPRIPVKPLNQFLSISDGKNKWPNNKSAFGLTMILYFLNVINPKHSFKTKFQKLLKKHPEIDTKAMGFPEDWKRQKLWD